MVTLEEENRQSAQSAQEANKLEELQSEELTLLDGVEV